MFNAAMIPAFYIKATLPPMLLAGNEWMATVLIILSVNKTLCNIKWPGSASFS